MFLAWGEPDYVARTDLLDRASPTLCHAAAGRHKQRLSERMCVPRSPGARFKRDAGADGPRRGGWLEQGINAHRACEILARSFAGRLCATSLDFHVLLQ